MGSRSVPGLGFRVTVIEEKLAPSVVSERRQLIGTPEGGAAHATSSTLTKRAGTEIAADADGDCDGDCGEAAPSCCGGGGWKTQASAVVGAMLPPRTVRSPAVASGM